MRKSIALFSMILFLACSPNDREDKDILQNQETRLFAQPEYQPGLVEINLEGEELTTLLADQPKMLIKDRTAFSRSTNEIITLFSDFTPKIAKINIDSKVVTETSRSSSNERLIVSPDGRLFTYDYNIGLILELNFTTGHPKDTILDLPARANVHLRHFVFNEYTDELFATGKPFLGVQGFYGDPILHKINVNTGAMREIPIEVTNVNGEILSVNDLMFSKDGRLFAQVDHSWFVQLDVNDASLIKVITTRDGFYHGTFSNSTNEIVGFEGKVMYRINVETGEIITKDLVQRYGYFLSGN